MSETLSHLAGEELLLFVEGELPPHRAAGVAEHLDRCAHCRARAAEMENTLRDFLRFHEARTIAVDGSLTELRDRLVRELSKETARPAGGFRPGLLRSLPLLQWGIACAALVIATGALWILHSRNHPSAMTRASQTQNAALPVRALTPGFTRPVAYEALCSTPDPEDNGPIDDSVAAQVFQEYGLAGASRSEYEVDYLITPGLGGSDDIRNLWPEPYSSTEWNAHVKDLLESYLHQRVCEGKMPLSTAQNEIASDWIAAYKRHFHTEKPLAESAMAAAFVMPPESGPE